MTTQIDLKTIKTSRLNISYYSAGDQTKRLIILIHGNVSSKLFWENTIKDLAQNYWVLAPDLRGYGDSENLPIDATQGLKEWSDDIKSFVEALQIDKQINFVGWSLGGGIVMQYAIDYSEDLDSLILVNPISPFGFGGTKDEIGTQCYPSYSGSGGGTANPEFIELLRNRDKGENSPNSPRNVLNNFYFKPSFKASKEQEELFIDSMLSTRIGDDFYPGTFQLSADWPGIAPGATGINNAMSPKYMNLSPIVDINNKIPILWIRGENDLIVSDQSFFDFGFLGEQGYVPDWPGIEKYPPQPMVSQTRYVLEKYQDNGGVYEEFVIEDSGHSPFIEKPDIFHEKIRSFLKDK